MFELNPVLDSDTVTVVEWPLSLVLLSLDANYPWCVLVPRRSGIREIYELDPADREQLLRESCALGEAMMNLFQGDKLNVAALGNMVPQLHVHHVVRYEGDEAWPGPIWGVVDKLEYSEELLHERVEALRDALADAEV
jgi:diadenosine tetraphosphate (Ap4A) HIT family hydrolase